MLREVCLLFEHNVVTCNFCGKPDPVYYCNNCNTVFCTRCKKEEVKKLALCGSCGAKITEINCNEQDFEVKFKCHKCKSTRYIIGQKRSKNCPGCNQSNITTIAEKKRNLMETSRRLIFQFRDGYRDLYTYLKRLEHIRDKLVNLRTCGFFHDPKIEVIMLKLIKSIQILKNQIIFRVEQDHKILQMPLQKFLDPTKWTPDKFFLLEASLDQIKEIMNNFRFFLEELIGNQYKDLSIAEGKLQAITYYKNIYDEFETLLDILPGELPICAFKELKFKKTSFTNLRPNKGILFLTDRRMIFLRKKGIIFKKHEHSFDFFLEGFERVEIVGRIFKKLKFSLEEGTLKFAAQEKVMRAIKNYYNISTNFEKYRAEAEIPTGILEPIDLDLLDLKEKIEIVITSLLSLNQISYFTAQQPYSTATISSFQNNSGEPNEFPSTNIQRILFKIQSEEFSLKNTLQNLEAKFNQKIISAEEYIRQFRHLQAELFKIRRRIEDIKRQTVMPTEIFPMSQGMEEIPMQNNTPPPNLFPIGQRLVETRRQNVNDPNEKEEMKTVPLDIFD